MATQINFPTDPEDGDIHTENELYRGSLTKYREKVYADNIEVS